MKKKNIKLMKSLREVIDYCYMEEFRDWIYSRKPSDHILPHYVVLKEHLDSLEKQFKKMEYWCDD